MVYSYNGMLFGNKKEVSEMNYTLTKNSLYFMQIIF